MAVPDQYLEREEMKVTPNGFFWWLLAPFVAMPGAPFVASLLLVAWSCGGSTVLKATSLNKSHGLSSA